MADNLNVEFKGLENASKSLDKIINGLGTIEVSVTKNMKAVTNLSNSLTRLGKTDFNKFISSSDKAAQSIDEMSNKLSKVNTTSFANVTKDLNSFSKSISRISGSNIDQLKSQMDSSVPVIEKFASNLNQINSTGFENTSKSLNSFSKSMTNLNNVDLEPVKQKISNFLPQLDTFSTKLNQMDVDGFKSVSAGVNSFTTALRRINDINLSTLTQQMQNIVPAITEFGNKINQIDMSGFTSTAESLKALLTTLGRLPKIAENLNNIDLSRLSVVFSTLNQEVIPFITTLKDASGELSSFATILQSLTRVSTANSFNKLRQGAQKYSEEVEKATTKTNLFKKVIFGLNVGTIYALYNQMKHVASSMSNMVTYASSYTENLNLAQNVFGEYYENALDFQDKLHNALMTNENEMIKYQATYMSMLQAVSGNDEVSYAVSEQLSKMSLDIASLYNVTEEQASSDLKSAISGMTKPIRKYGLTIKCSSPYVQECA